MKRTATKLARGTNACLTAIWLSKSVFLITNLLGKGLTWYLNGTMHDVYAWEPMLMCSWQYFSELEK